MHGIKYSVREAVENQGHDLTELEIFNRLAAAAERAFPPHGWDYRRVGWLTEYNSPEGKSLEALNRTARPRWEVVSDPNNDHIGYLLRRPAPAPEAEGHDYTCAECGATGRTEHGMETSHKTTCSSYIPF